MIDLVSKRYVFIVLSLVIIVPGLIFVAIGGLKPGIDFTGGSSWELSFQGNPPALRDIEDTMAASDQKFVDALKARGNLAADEQRLVDLRAGQKFTAVGQPSEGGLIVVRTGLVELLQEKQAIENDLKAKFSNYKVGSGSVTSTGPTVAGEVTTRSILAVVLVSVGVLLYLAYAFRKVKNPLRYGLCAIFAMLHDVAVVIGVFAVLGFFFGVEIDSLIITAILTVIGFSVHDTIVVFDRIRENQIKNPGEDFPSLVNHSLVQTLARSINTSLTVIFTLTALYLFGGVTIRNFVLALLIGIISGTYSSIFNASMLLVIWEHDLRGNRGDSTPRPNKPVAKPKEKITV